MPHRSFLYSGKTEQRSVILTEARMRIHNLYVDAEGVSHFATSKWNGVEERRGSKLSARLPATCVIFRQTRGVIALRASRQEMPALRRDRCSSRQRLRRCPASG